MFRFILFFKILHVRKLRARGEHSPEVTGGRRLRSRGTERRGTQRGRGGRAAGRVTAAPSAERAAQGSATPAPARRACGPRPPARALGTPADGEPLGPVLAEGPGAHLPPAVSLCWVTRRGLGAGGGGWSAAVRSAAGVVFGGGWRHREARTGGARMLGASWGVHGPPRASPCCVPSTRAPRAGS